MDIPIGNVLSDIVKLLNPFILQLLTGRLFCHLIQKTFNIGSRTVVMLPFVIFVFPRNHQQVLKVILTGDKEYAPAQYLKFLVS